jgi:hypothetical protein
MESKTAMHAILVLTQLIGFQPPSALTPVPSQQFVYFVSDSPQSAPKKDENGWTNANQNGAASNGKTEATSQRVEWKST